MPSKHLPGPPLNLHFANGSFNFSRIANIWNTTLGKRLFRKSHLNPENIAFFSPGTLSAGKDRLWNANCHHQSNMTLAEILIIYLACGAPFGVQYLLDSNHRRVLHTIAGVLSRFIIWPVGAAIMLARLSKAAPRLDIGGSNFDGDALARIRSRFESQIMLSNRSASVFEFRDAFLRYTGLAGSACEVEIWPGVSELFRVAGHPDEHLAVLSLQRKNTAKLEYHRERSRNEFSRTIESLVSTADNISEIIMLAVETAECVSDRRYANELRRRYGLEPRLASDISAEHNAGELWKTGSQHHSIAN